MAIVKMLTALGVKDIVICDTKGIISKSTKGLAPSKQELAELTNQGELTGTLADAVRGPAEQVNRCRAIGERIVYE